MLKALVLLASIANCAGGVVLVLTWATMSARVPIIVLFIGAALLIQGGYTILYLRGTLAPWGDIATGALFAGEGLAACVGAAGLVLGLIHNIQHADMEMAPVLAGLLMLAQAVLALIYLFLTNRIAAGLKV